MTEKTAVPDMFGRVKERVVRLRPFIGSSGKALTYLVHAKFDKTAEGRARYKNMPFYFRPPDMSAIWEVLGEEEYSFLQAPLKSVNRPVILDVGAHIGLFGLWALGENPGAQILSVEASPHTFKTLQTNIEAAGKSGQWKAVNAAAWKDDSNIVFKVDGDSMGHRVDANAAGITARGMPLSRMVEAALSASGTGRIDLMKVDIEGSEEMFLSAGESLLPEIDAVVIELHPKLCDTAHVRDILSRHYSSIVACADETMRKPLLYCKN